MKRGFINEARLHLAVTPAPVSPSPARGRGGVVERGAAPLLNTPLEGRGIKGGFKRGEASLPYPPSPSKERGIKGVR